LGAGVPEGPEELSGVEVGVSVGDATGISVGVEVGGKVGVGDVVAVKTGAKGSVAKFRVSLWAVMTPLRFKVATKQK